MKISFIMLIIYASFSAFTQEVTSSILTDILEDPSTSFRCKELIKKRNQKVFIRQKAQSLLQKSRKLQEVTPKRKESIKRKLQRNMMELEQKIYLTNTQIKKMEERIIRNGCPGLLL